MTKIFVDTEFLENGQTIDLISIGMITEFGDEFYGVNADCNQWAIKMHHWLPANVWKNLPLAKNGVALDPLMLNSIDNSESYLDNATWLNTANPAVMHRLTLADRVKSFILSVPEPELWADHAATDHVALYQLFGRMVDVPEGVPWFTHEFQTFLEYGFDTSLSLDGEKPTWAGMPPSSRGNVTEHHALSDAFELMRKFFWLAPDEFQGSQEYYEQLFDESTVDSDSDEKAHHEAQHGA